MACCAQQLTCTGLVARAAAALRRMPDAPKGGEYVAISTPETGDREDADAGDEPAVPAKSPPGAAPMGFASTGSCFVALTNTILGSGMLGLPHAFSSCGYILGLFFLVAGALASSLGLHLLACSANTLWMHEGKRSPTSFYKVAKFALPRWYLLIDLAVAIKCFGVGCSYLVVIGDLMPEAMHQLAPAATLLHQRTFWVLAGWVVVGPLSFMTTLDKLKVTNRLAILCVLLVAGLVVAYALDYAGLVDGGLDACLGVELGEERTQCRGETHLAIMNMDTVKTLTVYIFAFTCHQNIFGVCNELENFSVARCNTVIRTSIGCSGLIYIVVAVAGYYTYGTEVASDILVSYPQTNLLSAARVFISVLVAFSYPLQCLPSRAAATTLWASCDDACSKPKAAADATTVAATDAEQPAKIEPEPEPEPEPASSSVENEEEEDDGGVSAGGGAGELVSLTGGETTADVEEVLRAESSARCRYITLTSIFLCGTLTVALTLADLGVLLSVVGATGSTIVSYILPGSIYYSMHSADTTWKRKAAACMFFAGCGIIPLALGFILFGGASH